MKRERIIRIAVWVVCLAMLQSSLTGCTSEKVANTACIQNLEQALADGTLNESDKASDLSILNDAVDAGDYGCVKAILEAGADPNHLSDSELSNLYFTFWSSFEDIKILKLLIENGAVPADKDELEDLYMIAEVEGGRMEKYLHEQFPEDYFD